jgi:acetolactate synthase regulatory subunit
MVDFIQGLAAIFAAFHRILNVTESRPITKNSTIEVSLPEEAEPQELRLLVDSDRVGNLAHGQSC